MPRRARRRRHGALLCLLPLLLAARLAGADTVQVQINGLDGEMTENVRAFLGLARAEDAGTPLNPLTIRGLHDDATEQIRQALRPFGHYRPDIDASLQPPPENGRGGQWTARYTVDAGPPVRLARVSIRAQGPGADDEELDARIANARLREGEVLSHPAYEQTKSRLEEAAHSLGYRDATFTKAMLEVDPARLEAYVDLTLTTGIRYRFGELTIEQDVISEEHLREYATFEAGDTYSTRKLLDFEYRLFDTGYFDTVRLEPMAPEGDRIPIRLTASPGPRRAWNLRAGYGTDTGPRVGVGFRSPRLNREGHRLRLDLELSAPQQEFGGEYVTPLDEPATDQRAYQLGTVNQRLGDTDSRRVETGIRETRRDGAWQRVRYLRYRSEVNVTSGERSTAQLLVPGYGLIRANSNDVTYPTRGSYVEADVHGGLGAVLSDTSFLQISTDLRLIRPMGERNRILLRGEAGAVIADDFEQLPASERFFAGGDRSVRGFRLNDLGPRDEEGQVVGGPYLLVGSVEYERRILGNWGVGVFVDAGDAFHADDFGLQVSAGAGLRWLSPIGMVRVDLARALTDEGDGVRLHFTFGPEL